MAAPSILGRGVALAPAREAAASEAAAPEVAAREAAAPEAAAREAAASEAAAREALTEAAIPEAGDVCDAASLGGSGVALFDSDTEGFALDPYHDLTATNLADANKPAVPPPMLSFDATQGSPSPGSLQVTAPFSGANQYVEIDKLTSASAPLDWRGMILHLRLKVSQGTFHGEVQVYVSTSSVYAFGGTYAQVGTGSEWQDFALDVSPTR